MVSFTKLIRTGAGVLFLAVFLSGCDAVKSIYEQAMSAIQGKPGDAKKAAVRPGPAVAPSPGPAPSSAPASKMEDVLARVGNWIVTVEQFNDRLKALKEVMPEYDINNSDARRMILDELVRQQLLVEEAEQKGIAGEKEIRDAVEEFRRTLIVREAVRSLTENIEATEEDARKFYEEREELFVSPGEWRVREIVVGSDAKAKELLGEILKGADFAEMARQNSTGKTAADGGDLGFIQEEPFPQMGAAILTLQPGDVSGVFQGPGGYYIVKLEEKKGGEPLAFDAIKDDLIQNQTLMKQQQAIMSHLQELEKSIPVHINEELLNSKGE